jgi:hypothetical protein
MLSGVTSWVESLVNIKISPELIIALWLTLLPQVAVPLLWQLMLLQVPLA